MNFLSRLFGHAAQPDQPDIPFGRFSDAYKSDEQQQAFDRSLEAFEQGDALIAYREFMHYLVDEEAKQPNIRWEEKDGVIHFELFQGSQRITGVAGQDMVKAESRVARANDLNVGFMRRLMEANFNLKFSRFALDNENNLCIVFDTRTADGSPLKILHALRELAIHADKQDDLLLGEFAQVLSPADGRNLTEIPEEEKEIKYRYIVQSIQAVMAEMDKGKPDPNTYPGTYAYLFLALAFKLDYLIKPEGFMMDLLERVYAAYFSKNNLTPQVKLQQMRREFQTLLDRPREAFFAEMYRTQSTFGANPAVPHGTVASFIDGELANMEWPLQQGHDALAAAIPQYIAGFILFHQAPPRPDRAFLHLFFQITESDFFRQLGFKIPFTDESGRLNKAEILREIKRLAEQYRSDYPKLKPDVQGLNFASHTLFAKSYLQMIKGLDVTREM
ncbi:MAG TPA: hypothetical protein VK168_01315 [Saprospiraceae bacterium]|nr:hypothetical protein [Saprospiraceae bacterium]